MPDCDSALSLRPYSSVYFIGNSFFKGLLHIIFHKVMENMNKTELLSTVFWKSFDDVPLLGHNTLCPYKVHYYLTTRTGHVLFLQLAY